jgi:hypothetical protein
LLRGRRSKDLKKKKLDEDKPEDFLEVKFKWQPGVVVNIVESKQHYQISDVLCNPLTKQMDGALEAEGYYFLASTSEIAKLSEAERARLIHLNFIGRLPCIETNVPRT